MKSKTTARGKGSNLRRPKKPCSRRTCKGLVGKLVALTWKDPTWGRAQVENLEQLTRGRASLATWVDYGRVESVSAGVVIIVHSTCSDGTVSYSCVPEVLIEEVKCLR